MKKVIWFFVFTIAFSNLKLVLGFLRCYGCSLPEIDDGDEDADLGCLKIPANVSKIIHCPSRMKYCMIYRTDYKESGNIASLLRSCEEKPPFLNDDIEDPKYITHYRACQTDLCNDGDGIKRTHGVLDIKGNGGITAILVEDERSGAMSAIKINILLLCWILLAYVTIL